MGAAATTLLILALATAVADWWAVLADRSYVESILKPLVMVLLGAMVLAGDPADEAAAVVMVIGLAWSLLGDLALLPSIDRFIPGLAAFLLAHVAYLVGLPLAFDLDGILLGLAGAAMVFVGLTIGRRIVTGARSQATALTVPVAAYIAVIGAMVAVAVATGEPLAGLGAVSFAVSDAVLGWNRFVTPLSWGRPVVMVTYHLGQAGLATSILV